MKRINAPQVALAALVTGLLLAPAQTASSSVSMSTASQIKALQQQVKILNAQVAGLRKSKADNVDLATVASGVLSNTSNIQLLTQAAAGLQASLGSLQSSMTGLATAIGLKADASGLDLKADKTALNDLVQKVMQLQANH